MVRMVDVASHAGVSLKTVSRVLNNEPHVQDKLREKVHASVKALGYIPSVSARSLRSNRTYTFHLISRAIDRHFMTSIQAGAIMASQQNGYNLIVTLLSFEVLNDPESLETWCTEFIQKKRPDGVILVPPHSEKAMLNTMFNEAGIPIARIGPNKIIDFDNISIAIDDQLAAKEATKHLIKLGHQRIGFLRGYEDQFATHARYNGYCDALNEAGISIDDNLVRPGLFNFESGMKAGLELLALKDRPTAIFAANDDMAAGVIVAAYRNDISIPAELSIIGFDDSEIAKCIWPTLTTVRQPLIKYGESAVRHLVSRAGQVALKSKQKNSTHQTLDHYFIERCSTAPLQKG